MPKLRYILVTPARNEAAFLEQTIRSVIGQTVPPVKWVVVSDGSTDGTDEVIKSSARRHTWIQYLRRPEHADRQFAAKVRAFNAGYAVVRSVPHEIIGNLDADLTFEPDAMEFLLERFAKDPCLGVAGFPFIEHTGKPYDYRFTNIEHVSGACQLFRRECFEAVGGYKPIEGGGIDWLAVTTARMMGWKTRTFTVRAVIHHRTIGTGANTKLRFLFRQGVKEYYLGNHPAWQFFRSLYQVKKEPFIIGGMAIFAGYFVAFIKGVRRQAPPEVIRFCRIEQMRRLRAALKIGKRAGAESPPPRQG